jgi:hypothetical protein
VLVVRIALEVGGEGGGREGEEHHQAQQQHVDADERVVDFPELVEDPMVLDPDHGDHGKGRAKPT